MQKCGPESLSTQAILKQIWHKSYVHLEFHLCAFLRIQDLLHFRTCNCCIYISLDCVTKSLNRSFSLTCLASVLVLVNVSISVAAMEGFSETTSAAIAPSKRLWNNGPHTQSKKSPQKSLRSNLSN